jgi:hypothetical protein
MGAAYQLLLLALPALLPPLTASVAVLVVGRLLRRPVAGSPRGWSGALAVGAGYAAGHVAVRGWPPLPPVEAAHRLFYLAALAAGLGLLWDGLRRPWLRGGLFLLAAVAGQAFLLYPALDTAREWGAVTGFELPESLLGPVRSSAEWADAAAWLTLLGLVSLLFWAGLDAAAPGPGVVLGLTVAAVLAGSAALMQLGHSTLLSLLTTGLLSASVPALLWAWWQPGFSPRGALTVVGLVLPGLWSAGVFYGDVPAGSVLLLAAVPAAAWLARRVPAWRLPRWPVAVARVAVPLLLVPLALWQARPPASEDDEMGAYENWSPPAANSGGGKESAPAARSASPPDDDNPFAHLPDSPP